MFVKGQQKSGGRAKGTVNKTTADLKGMILKALHKAGGEKYLVKQAVLNPAAFMALISKILPRDINANLDVSDALAERIKAARESKGN
jgi:hypothetical protein